MPGSANARAMPEAADNVHHANAAAYECPRLTALRHAVNGESEQHLAVMRRAHSGILAEVRQRPLGDDNGSASAFARVRRRQGRRTRLACGQ